MGLFSSLFTRQQRTTLLGKAARRTRGGRRDTIGLGFETFEPRQMLAADVLLDGDVRIVAMFEPAEVLGRVHAGQSGTLRVEGRTSTPLRSIRGRVERVGRELRDGLVRVELVLEATPEASRLAQHGLRGTVEIEVERVSPAELVLRAAGRLVAP